MSIKQIHIYFLFVLFLAGLPTTIKAVTGNNGPEAISEMIDRIIKEPSSPITMGFDPLLMKSMPVANPTAKVELIHPPEVNNLGTAELSYHFEMTPARNGMQPQLSIHYNSDAGVGRLGTGWDLYIPTITANISRSDLAFGSAYMMDGEMIMEGQQGGQQFYPRRQTDFQQIIRNGNSPNNYTWKITNTKGTIYKYGIEREEVLNGVLRTGNVISEWKLSRVEEVHGSYIEYIYRNCGNAICLDTIKAGNKGEDPHTIIEFSYRPANNFLSKIVIKFEDKKARRESEKYKPLRSYTFNYEQVLETDQLFLTKITHNYYYENISGNLVETPFASHTFNYYDDKEKIEKLTAYIERTGNTEYNSLLIDRTAKLHTVHNPLGGCFTIDYDYAPAADVLGSEEEIEGKLVMKSVRINDGVFDDGTNTKYEFAYSEGIYDDREKTFLGYGNVIIKHIDTEAEEDTDAVYRYILQTYDVASYYTCGNLLGSVTTGSDPTVRYKEERYEYYSYWVTTIENNYNLGSNPNNFSFSPLKYIKTTLYDEGANIMVATEKYYTYYLNEYGGLKTYTYSDKGTLGNSGGGAYNYKLKVEYNNPNASEYIVNLPTKVEVTGDNGTKYRETIAEYDNFGRITKITQALDRSGNTAVTDIKYDGFGNIVEKILPANHKNDRMTYKYLYDRDYNMYVERVEDSFGYRTEMEDYDYRYGIALTTRDMNRYTLTRTIDDLGRLSSVTSPNEQESGKDYTIAFEYHLNQVDKQTTCEPTIELNDPIFLDVPEYIYYDNYFSEETIAKIMGSSEKKECISLWEHEKRAIVDYDNIKIDDCYCSDIATPAYAITKRYDYAHPDDPIETVLFVDGMGRIIQEKRDAEITSSVMDGSNLRTDKNSMIVSGRTFYDPFGRAIKKYHPTTDPLTRKDAFKPGFDQVDPTEIKYDILDRITEVSLPENGITTTSYFVNNTTRSIRSVVTDPTGRENVYFTNGSGLVTEERQGFFRKNFIYDPIGQLVEMQQGNERVQYEYDLMGKCTKVISPEGGETVFTYDGAGNLIEKQTANLKIDNKIIEYKYDYNRLIQIIYPQNEENNVTYTYGNRNASHNRVGRIMLQEDASGAQEFFYGRLGEVSKVRRTIIIPNQAIATYVTQWQYDSWNRLTEIIYPDGEKVTYSYNLGGLLEGMKGGKSYCYNYVNLLGYDKFEQRVYMEYGNKMVTIYGYGERNQYLYQSRVWSSGGTQILHNSYGFTSGEVVTYVGRENELGRMQHSYGHNNEYCLSSADAFHYDGNSRLNGFYNISFRYDNGNNMPMVRTEKEQHIEQDNFISSGILSLKDNRGTFTGSYDANGNLTHIEAYSGEDASLPTGERKFIWDEENRLRSIKDDSYVSHYLYDAQGNRVVKTSGGSENVYLNSLFSGGSSDISAFTAYINPYMEVGPDGQYIKHFFIGNERVVSKLGDLESYGSDPRRIEYAGHDVEGVEINYKDKYEAARKSIKEHYEHFSMPYQGRDNDDYVGGQDFCCYERGIRSGNVGTDKEDEELKQYYYHNDYLGSTVLLTDLSGKEVQHIDYLPFGELFFDICEGDCDWYTRYLFHGKEYDEETGFYYYDGRYYYPNFGVWLNVSSPFDRNTALTPYVFKNNNPGRQE